MGMPMQLACTVLATLVLPALAAAAQPVSVEVHGRYFGPSDSAFRDVYGSGPQYGAQLTRGVGARWDAWGEASRLARSGELTFTREPTKMSLLRIAAGARRRFGDGRLAPYAAAGLGVYRLSETNVLGSVTKAGFGVLARLGILVKIRGPVQLDAGVGYSHCQVKPAGLKVQLGGLEAGVGLAFRF
jgi:hypothetical protein